MHVILVLFDLSNLGSYIIDFSHNVFKFIANETSKIVNDSLEVAIIIRYILLTNNQHNGADGICMRIVFAPIIFPLSKWIDKVNSTNETFVLIIEILSLRVNVPVLLIHYCVIHVGDNSNNKVKEDNQIYNLIQ